MPSALSYQSCNYYLDSDTASLVNQCGVLIISLLYGQRRIEVQHEVWNLPAPTVGE